MIMGYDIYSCRQTLPPFDFEKSREDFEAYKAESLEVGDYARFNSTAWPKLLNLAESFGWIPAGTLPPPGIEDDSEVELTAGYMWNSGRIVTAEDALNLAEALEKSLPNIVDQEEPDKLIELKNPSEDPITDLFRKAAGEGTYYGPNSDMPEYKYFGGELKQRIIYFIRLCRKGDFAIY